MDIECIGDDFEEMEELTAALAYEDALNAMTATERDVHFAYSNARTPKIGDMVACRYMKENHFIGTVRQVDVMARDGIMVFIDSANPVDVKLRGKFYDTRDGFAIEVSAKSNGSEGIFPVEAL